jgi:hypothetical protein
MSNVKEFHVVADLPWDWASELSAEDCARIAALTLNPVVGVDITQTELGYKLNEQRSVVLRPMAQVIEEARRTRS